MIYIASPYSNPDPLIKIERYRAIFRFTTNLMQQGSQCFSPIVYGHQFHMISGLPESFEYWQAFNERMMLASDELVVLKLSGWEASRGVAHEINFASRHGIPHRFVAP